MFYYGNLFLNAEIIKEREREKKLNRLIILYTCFVKDNCAGNFSYDLNFKEKDKNYENIFLVF